jgi:SWI/SNF-related matrix-associated actin-dependent regulator of chromatin subfamily A-like protein 1
MSTRSNLIEMLGPLADVAVPHLQGPLYEARTGMTAMARARDAELLLGPGVLAPGVTLYPFQRAGVKFALETKRCILGHDMGLGKSIQAITVLAITKAFPAVIVVPPSLALNWEREFKKFAPQIRTHVIRGKANYELPEVDVFIIGDAVVAAWEDTLVAQYPQALIVDEMQRIKSKDAQRSKAVKEIARRAEPTYRIGLSGTIVKNRPDELINPLLTLDVMDSVFGGVIPFLNRFYPKVNRYDREARQLDTLHAELVDTVYARLAFAEVADQLGMEDIEVRRLPVLIEMSGKAAAEYRQARDELRDYLLGRYEALALADGATEGQAEYEAQERTRRAMRAEALVKLNSLRRLIGLAKVDSVVSYVRNLVEDGDQVIVFANHRDVVTTIAEAFKAPTIKGGDKPEAVQAGKDAFQAGDARVIVLNIEAGGTGHTLTAAKHVVFAEYGWTPSDMTQAEARAYRIGQTSDVVSHWVSGANGEETIDERLVSILNTKSVVTSTILDGKGSEMIEHEATLDSLIDWAKGE